MVDNGEQISQTLKREFGEEALNSLEMDGKEQTKEAIEKLFQSGDIVSYPFYFILCFFFLSFKICNIKKIHGLTFCTSAFRREGDL